MFNKTEDGGADKPPPTHLTAADTSETVPGMKSHVILSRDKPGVMSAERPRGLAVVGMMLA